MISDVLWWHYFWTAPSLLVQVAAVLIVLWIIVAFSLRWAEVPVSTNQMLVSYQPIERVLYPLNMLEQALATSPFMSTMASPYWHCLTSSLIRWFTSLKHSCNHSDFYERDNWTYPSSFYFVFRTMIIYRMAKSKSAESPQCNAILTLFWHPKYDHWFRMRVGS